MSSFLHTIYFDFEEISQVLLMLNQTCLLDMRQTSLHIKGDHILFEDTYCPYMPLQNEKNAFISFRLNLKGKKKNILGSKIGITIVNSLYIVPAV